MRNFKKVTLVLLALAAVLLGLSGRALASGAVDTEAETSLTVFFAPGGIPAQGVEFRLYRAAEISPAGVHSPMEGYPPLPEEDTAEAWRQYAAELQSYVAGGVLPAAAIRTDKDGGARGERLAVGLYFVTGEGFYRGGDYISPAAFTVSLPRQNEAEQWQYDVTVTAKYEILPGDPTLPQTGILRWPVPVLLGSGLVILGAGMLRRRKKKEE